MNITNIRASDVVECDVRGIKFFATVDEIGKGELHVKPHSKQINHFHIKATQVVGHYKKMSGSR